MSRRVSGSGALAVDHLGADRRHLHLAEPGADICREAGIGGDGREFRGLVGAQANAGIGHQPVGGGDDVAGAQRGVERQIDRRQPGRASAVAGAVGAQRLAIGIGVFAVGIALAIACGSAIDVAAVEDLGDARRAECLAGLNRRGVAAHGQRKIFAVAASHAEGRSGARDARRWRWCGWRLIDAERIGEEIRLRGGLPRLFLDAAEQEIEQALGRDAAGHEHKRARKGRGGHKCRAAPPARKSQLCTQRQLHPTQPTR